MKLYTNPTCHYCNKIKSQLDEAGIEYTEIITSDNVEEWNNLIRITGLGMTPTIVYQEETWMPNRDFRTAEELVARIKHFEQYPMTRLSLEDKVEQVNNAVKNITLLLNQMNQQIQGMQQKLSTTPPVNTSAAQSQIPPLQPQAQPQI